MKLTREENDPPCRVEGALPMGGSRSRLLGVELVEVAGC